MCPSLRTTRWHGIRSGTGFFASADPAARTAPGWPISLAIQLYGRTSPGGISSAFISTARSNSERPAQVEPQVAAGPCRPCSFRTSARTPAGGTVLLAMDRAARSSRWNAALELGRATSPADHRDPGLAVRDVDRPDRRLEPPVRVGQTDPPQHGRQQRRGRLLAREAPQRPRSPSARLHRLHFLTPFGPARLRDIGSRRAMIARCTFDFAVPSGCSQDSWPPRPGCRPSTYRRTSGSRYRSGSPPTSVAMSARRARLLVPRVGPRGLDRPAASQASSPPPGSGWSSETTRGFLPAEPVARHVQRDLVEPRPQRHRADALGRVRRRARDRPARRRPARPPRRPAGCRSRAARRSRAGPGRRARAPRRSRRGPPRGPSRSASSCVIAHASPFACSGCPSTSRKPGTLLPVGRAPCPVLRGASADHLALQPAPQTRAEGPGLQPLRAPSGTRLPAIAAAIDPAWWRLFSMKIRPTSRPPRIAPAR